MNRRSTKYLLLLGTLVVLFGMLLRFPNLLQLPLYVDETQHIYRSQRIAVGEVFEGIDQNKWLFSLAAGALFARGQETIFIARTVSVLCSAITIATCIAIGKSLQNKWAGLLAGLFYAAFPFGVFHERQALVDPMLTMFTTLVIALSLVLVKRPRWWVAVLLMLSMAGAYLTKTAGLPYYIMPFVALVLYIRFDEYGWLLKWLKATGYAVAAVVISLAMRGFFYAQSELAGIEPRDTHTATLENTVFGQWSNPDVQTRFYRDLGLLLELIARYAGPIIIVLCLLGLVWLFRSNKQRDLLFIMAAAFGLLWVPILAERPTFWSFPSRYFMTSGPPLAILAAVSLMLWFASLRRGRATIIWAAALLVTAQGVIFTLFAASNPDSVLLAYEDLPAYDYADLAYRAAGEAVVELWEDGTAEQANILFHGTTHQLSSVYIGNHIGDGYSTWEHPRLLREAITPKVVNGDDFYLVEDVGKNWPAPIEQMEYGQYLEVIGDYSHPLADNTMRVYRVTAFDGRIAEAAYRKRVPDVDKLTDDAQIVINDINAHPDRTVIVFPVAQVEPFETAVSGRVIPLQLDIYPPQQAEVEQEFRNFNLGDHGDPIEFVAVEQSQIDPQRVILKVLQQNFYFAGDTWTNLHHRQTYYTGPANPQTDDVGAIFEGGIALTSAAILDSTPHEAIRIALVWETPTPIGDPFNIFVHVVDAAGNVVAQYDRQPGNDLLPMTIWEPGEPVTDRIAVSLSDDIAPGTYSLYVGIYQQGSGIRLPVIEAPEHGSDYVVLGQVVVE